MFTIKKLGVVFSAIMALGLSLRAQSTAIPEVTREFRGLWVATVDNVDWPSSKNLTTRQQKDELTAIMDRAVRLNLNVIVLQVRPACDAMYASKIEPWSEYLTGQMGKAPKPYYDPLTFAVEEAHKRGLELHAWFNPYRARLRDSKSPTAKNHVAFTHPSLVRTYVKYFWLDPTEPATREYSLSVIMDVVRRYDIDGVHFDDYFYPYLDKAPGEKVDMDFPDGAAWKRYEQSGGKLSRHDWRREQVNEFVQAVASGIKREKPWVKFGISPFGIWQPDHPKGIAGLNSFDTLYCDSKKWLNEGWVDYMAPQLYWPVADKPHAYQTLLRWWEAQNLQHRILCPGVRVEGWKGVKNGPTEVAAEALVTREEPGAMGEIFWHSKPIMANRNGVSDALQKVYAQPALMPAYPWLDKGDRPVRPVLSVKEGRKELKASWTEITGEIWQWVIRKKSKGEWSTTILPGEHRKEFVFKSSLQTLPEVIAVSAVNRCGNMSEPAVFNTGHLEQ